MFTNNKLTNLLKEGVENVDTISVSVPLFIRLLEFAKEDAKDDMVLHKVTENILEKHKNGANVLSMNDYDEVIKG